MTGETRRSLILLFGLPRSGTSWIGKIFDSHPNTLYRHEPDSGGALNAVPLVAPVEEAERYRHSIEDFVEHLPSLNSTKIAGSLPVFPKQYYPPARFALHRGLVVMAKAGAKVFGEFPVPAVVRFRRVPRLFVVWKSIESIGRLGVIARLVPERRAVVILRHPCGFVSSILRGEAMGKFTAAESAAEDYGILEALLSTPSARARGLSLERLKRLHPVERLAWRWVLFNETALAQIDGVAGCTYVRYEDLCAQPERRARELMEFAGLDWQAQTQAFVTESTSRSSSAYYSIFKDPVRAATSWQDQLAREHVDRIHAVVQDSRLAELYPAAADPAGSRPTTYGTSTSASSM